MKRLFFVLLAALVGVSACGSSSGSDDGGKRPLEIPSALTVNGEALSRDDLYAILDTYQANKDFVSVIGAQGFEIGAAGTGTYPSGLVQVVLQYKVLTMLGADEFGARKLELEQVDRTRAESTLSTVFAPVDPTTGQPNLDAGRQVLDGFPEAFRKELVDDWAKLMAVGRDAAPDAAPTGGPVSDEAIEAAYAAQFEEVCAHHILVAFPEGASPDDARPEALAAVEKLRDDIAGGSAFEDVAKASSDDPGSGANGGDLGCAPKGSYVPGFEDTAWSIEPGEISEPVESQFGIHLIRVDRRGLREDAPPLAEVRDQLAEQLEAEADQSGNAAVQEALGEWLSEALTDADVEVDPRFGEWNAETGGIEQPPGATTTTGPPLSIDPSLLGPPETAATAGPPES